jgi:hypothetical protein
VDVDANAKENAHGVKARRHVCFDVFKDESNGLAHDLFKVLVSCPSKDYTARHVMSRHVMAVMKVDTCFSMDDIQDSPIQISRRNWSGLTFRLLDAKELGAEKELAGTYVRHGQLLRNDNQHSGRSRQTS